MTWIRTITFQESTGALRKIYNRLAGPSGQVDNIMMAHSLRPHSMHGHMTLYKNVLHHSANTVDKWFLECLGVYVSKLNLCWYCVDHHAAGMARLLHDEKRTAGILAALESNSFAETFTRQEREALAYARLLTTSPSEITEDTINGLRESGWSDGEILEINQVTSYFSYANRTVLGLGVDTEGDVLGTSPHQSDDPDNWTHS